MGESHRAGRPQAAAPEPCRVAADVLFAYPR
jgi:hypothetical protein